MAYKRVKTEHAGAKNGGAAWMTRAEAKEAAKRKRRQLDKQALDPWTDPDPHREVRVAISDAPRLGIFL